MKELTIGGASRASGVKVPTIRYYEQIGLLPSPPRTDSNRRLYDERDLARLVFIRHARELGFDIEAIRTLLDLQGKPDVSCAAVDAIAGERLAEIDRRIARLTALKTELERMIHHSRHGRIAECRIIEVLHTQDPVSRGNAPGAQTGAGAEKPQEIPKISGDSRSNK